MVDEPCQRRPAVIRPRFRFGLRTLFVVIALVGVLGWWLRWNVNQVRQRKELVAYLQTLDHQPNPVRTWVISWDDGEERIPRVWRWLGASNENWGTWLLSNQELTDQQLARARWLLPDCTIKVYDAHNK